jgi:hypothetical protein
LPDFSNLLFFICKQKRGKKKGMEFKIESFFSDKVEDIGLVPTAGDGGFQFQQNPNPNEEFKFYILWEKKLIQFTIQYNNFYNNLKIEVLQARQRDLP